MAFPSEIFRSYDIRGLLEQVTDELAERVGEALVVKTRAKTVIVGRDMRSTSPSLAASAIKGITSMGADVIDIGMCTTSMYNFAVSSQAHVDAGLMVTASHNPPEYNGIKMALSNGLPISGKEMREELEKDAGDVDGRRVNLQVDRPTGTVREESVLEAYLERCLSVYPAERLEGAKIVVDYGNGMGAVSVRPLLERLGATVIELYADPDPRFPNHEANPAKEETLNDLKARIIAEKADIGIALDGDADRVAFVDNEGVSLRGDQTLALLAEDVLQREAGAKIVTAPNQSAIVFETIEKNGGHAMDSRIGRTYAIQAMVTCNAALGGEVSSHYFFREFANLESVDFAIVRVLSIWKRSGKSFADLVRPFRVYANSGEVNIEIVDLMKIREMLDERYAEDANEINLLDGDRFVYDDWWFIVRPSNTEPLVRLIVEAKSKEMMEAKRDEIAAVIRAV